MSRSCCCFGDLIGAAGARWEFVYSSSLLIIITTSTVINVRYISGVKKHKSLGLSPSTFLHFDSLDLSTAINDNKTDITRENIYTLKQTYSSVIAVEFHSMDSAAMAQSVRVDEWC